MAASDVFFFQAEDGIRDLTVTGVQTCALPIYPPGLGRSHIDCAPSWVVKCGIGTRAALGVILFTSADIGRLTIHSAKRSTFPMGIVCQGAETPSIKQTMTVILESPTATRIHFGKAIHISIRISPANPKTPIRNG